MSTRAVRIFVVAVTAILVIGGIAFGVRLVMPAVTPPAVLPQLATVARASFPVAINTTGTVVPLAETVVDFPTSGVIGSISVKVGQTVTSGTQLATLESAAQANAVSQANANLQTAEAALAAAQSPATPSQRANLESNLSNAQANLTQTTNSVNSTNAADAQRVSGDQAAISAVQTQYNTADCSNPANANSATCLNYSNELATDQHQLSADQATQSTDQANGQLRISQAQASVNSAQAALNAAGQSDPNAVSQAQANVTAAQAALNLANSNLSSQALVSPVSGTVLQINGQVGQRIAGTQSASITLPGTTTPTSALAPTTGGGGGALPFLVIGDPTSKAVGFAFPAADLGVVGAGHPAVVAGLSAGVSNISGSVLAVSASPVNIGGVPSYYATVTPNKTSSLTIGETVSVSVTAAQVHDALSVPSSAVYQLGGSAHVDVWNGHQAVPTAVSVGAQGISRIQITGGLSAGEQVVLVANQGLAQAVTP